MKTFEEHKKTVEDAAQYLAKTLERAHEDGYSFSVRFMENPFLGGGGKLRLITLVAQITPDVTGTE